MHTLILLGELDRTSAPTLEAAIEQLCETETAQITVDLSRLSYIDATGVAVLAFRCGWCERRGGTVALVPGTRPVQRAFELAGMADRLPFLQHGGERAAATAGLSRAEAWAATAATPSEPQRERARAVATRSRSIARRGQRRGWARRERLAGGVV
jgi:anti-anti-sigma factor